MLDQVQLLKDTVFLKDGHTVTTSLKVAEVFGKRHKNVLGAIDRMDCSEEFRGLNFEPGSYADAQGQMRPMFEVTRDNPKGGNAMNELTIINTPIRQDSEGRYCLNDLHKASGSANRHRPSLWLANKQTKSLVESLVSEQEFLLRNDARSEHELVLRIAPVSSTSVGSPATYIVDDLVYAYAMWISPEFHLRVIRAYKALVTGEFVRPSIQQENYWFSRRPHWPPIRERALAGMPYKLIAIDINITYGRVLLAIRRMMEVGLLSPRKLATVQIGPARQSARRMLARGWGLPAARQLSLFEEVPA